jgi:integrase
MALSRPSWLADVSRQFKRHRQGRSGWTIEVMRDRLRVVSTELPPRPEEPGDAAPKRRSVTLATPPGPAKSSVALLEACQLFDEVMAGSWRWPDTEAIPQDERRLSPSTLARLRVKLQAGVVGERISERTWKRTYAPYLKALEEVAAEHAWPDDAALLSTTLRRWQPNSRARQMAHDRMRRLWKEAGWPWPEQITTLRGNGKAAASPEGVRPFTDEEITELRARLLRSTHLSPADVVAWDCLVAFGLRPAELKGLTIDTLEGVPVAKVSREKVSSKGAGGVRKVPAVPPEGWPADCFELVKRWEEHGFPAGMIAAPSPGEVLAQQLARLKIQKPVAIAINAELTPYGCRHAFALRLAQRLGLHIREAAELMGHSPAVHLQTYGRRLDSPKLLASVVGKVKAQS